MRQNSGKKVINKDMKKLKLSIILVLTLGCIVSIGQAVKENNNSSVGNGNAMKANLNEPNAVNPAMDNIQSYEKKGVVLDMNNHPETDLSNSYNRNTYEGKK